MRVLFVSFQIEGVWTEPTNLGSPINSEDWDIHPSESQDDRYLFFTRREAWHTAEDSDIHRVSADFIEPLRGR